MDGYNRNSLRRILFHWCHLNLCHSTKLPYVQKNASGKIIDEGALLHDVYLHVFLALLRTFDSWKTNRSNVYLDQNRPRSQPVWHVQRTPRKD